jgi:hypothetical protein
MATMLDPNGVPQAESGFKRQKKAKAASGAEQAARVAIEQSCGRQLTDGEWAHQRRRLIEFVQTLARWDREHQIAEHKNNQTEASRQAVGD